MESPSIEEINDSLCRVLYNQYYADWTRVFNQKDCDIDSSFLGFVNIYYYLSKIIPKHFTVVDFGCAYAAQAYFFKDHKKYIGVDSMVQERFVFGNTEHILAFITDELGNWKDRDTSEVFAICSYVPANTDKLRMVFKNLFVYYPSDGCNLKKKILEQLKVKEVDYGGKD